MLGFFGIIKRWVSTQTTWNKADWGPYQCGDTGRHCSSSSLTDECVHAWIKKRQFGSSSLSAIGDWNSGLGVLFKQLSEPRGQVCWDWLGISALELGKSSSKCKVRHLQFQHQQMGVGGECFVYIWWLFLYTESKSLHLFQFLNTIFLQNLNLSFP